MERGRPKVPLRVSAEDRAALSRWVARRKTGNGLAQRARIVLRCSEGLPNTAVARELRITNATAGKWRQRSIAWGLAGLLDEPRCGAPRRIRDDQAEAVVVRTLESLPSAATHWTTRRMATRSGLSHTSVRRIWRAFGLQPHRVESFKLSNLDLSPARGGGGRAEV